MRASITIMGSDILCQSGGEIRIPLDETLPKLRDWAGRYERAVQSGDPAMLLSIGSEMWDWLNDSGWAAAWARGTGDRTLEIAVQDPGSASAAALLDLPWEILAPDRAYLAADPNQSFVVYRSIGRSADATPPEPDYRDLTAMFMAAAPKGQRELDFEAEETAILDATARLPMQLLVEESGCQDFLKERLGQEGPFEVVHLSCHGDIHPDMGPVLALETPEGNLAPATAGAITSMLGEKKAPLVFLSACRTAEALDNEGGNDQPDTAEPFVRALIRAGVANALGWDGSVYDLDAIQFARAFYRELAGFASAPYAAAMARREVLREHQNDPQKGRHWHLARVYVGSQGGGPLCAQGKPGRTLRKAGGYREFLDKASNRVPVATAQEFVGRRRQAQAILQALRHGEKAGALIYGMGQIGKSSLAARIANRMPTHDAVVIFERYDALSIFDQLVAALPGSEREKWEQDWRQKIARNAAALGDALEDMLNGPFDAKPILLIIDDLEQILDTPRPDQTVTPVKDADGSPDAWRQALGGVLRAFDASHTASRLLLTSRYRFTLPDGRGRDLANVLEAVQLRPMEQKERQKQWQAAAQLEARPEADPSDEQKALAARAQEVAGGNPGLQKILCVPILSGELAVAREAVDAIARWKASGELPAEESAAQAFFRRVSFDIYRHALTESQRIQLRAATLFSEGLPVPVAALESVGRASGVGDPKAAIDRLFGLGLMAGWGDIDGVAHAALNPLVRPIAGSPLTEKEQAHLAAAAMDALVAAWQDAEGDFPYDLRGVEAARLALQGDAPAEIIERSALTAGNFLFYHEHDAKGALAILEAARIKIDEAGGVLSPAFVLLASNCADRIGERDLQVALLERGLGLQSDNKVTLAQIAVNHATATLGQEGPDKALERLRDAVTMFDEAGDERSRAVTMGRIADILLRRGETDEALRIYREEQLPVYERLGDVQQRAVTTGKIADILLRRGETDEALRIRREEQLPVYERLGDVRSRAVTTGKIADILLQRGETDEALRIYREELIPIFERLGDVQQRAITMGKIAAILAQSGEIDEALRIHIEERLPAAEAIKDIDSIAHIRFSCAQLRLDHEGLKQENAQTIYNELMESFVIWQKLQRVDGIAAAGGLLGQVLAAVGQRDEAIAVLDTSAMAYEKLQQTQMANQVREWQKQIRERQ